MIWPCDKNPVVPGWDAPKSISMAGQPARPSKQLTSVHRISSRPALRSSIKRVKRLKLDTGKAAEFLIGTVLKLSASSIDLARSQALTRDFDFLLILVFFNDFLCFFIVF